MNKDASRIAKAAAIIMVLFHHMFLSTETILNNGGSSMSFYPFNSCEPVVWLAQSMKISVAVFVFVTAYGLCIKFKTNKHSNSITLESNTISRLVRLLANYQFIYITFFLIGLAVNWGYVLSAYGQDVATAILFGLCDLFGVARLFATPTLNGTWWYMSLAICLIVIMPMVYAAKREFGAVSTALFLTVVPAVLGHSLEGTLTWYLPTVGLALVFASYGLFDRILRKINQGSRIRSLILSGAVLAILVGIVLFRQAVGGFYWMFDAVAAALICILACQVERIGMLKKELVFIGYHSANVFMLHTFIYDIYFSRIIYSAPHFVIGVVVLLVLSLCCSVTIEFIKKKIRFYNVVDLLCERIGYQCLSLTE